jgi:hypothetical protein
MRSRSSEEFIPYDSARLTCGDIQNFAVASPPVHVCASVQGDHLHLRKRKIDTSCIGRLLAYSTSLFFRKAFKYPTSDSVVSGDLQEDERVCALLKGS